MNVSRRFPRSVDELGNIVALTQEFFAKAAIDPALRNVVDVCVEELFVNMIKYNTETDAEILLELARLDDGVEVSLTDYDVDRFDPREARSADVDAPLELREPGGLGLYLVLKMADAIHYEYHERTSRITFIAKRK